MAASSSMAPMPHRPFTFDRVFDGDRVIEPTRPKRTFTAEEVDALRTEAFAAGERSAVAEAERAAAAAMADAAKAIRHGLATLTEVAHQHRTGSAELALTAARKIADAALDRFPHEPLTAAMAVLAREVEAAPRLIIRCAADDPERLEAELNRIAEASGYPGQVVLKPGPGVAGAFQFDWGEGRAAFDPTAAADRIEAALRAALAAEGLHGEPLPLPPGDA